MRIDIGREIAKQDPAQIEIDLKIALKLLAVAGPNPLLIESENYWKEYNMLTDKYYQEEE